MRVKYAIACLSPQPPEWAEKMLGESQEYFGSIAEALTHPVDAIKAMAQETSNVYETEGLVYIGAYVIADIMIGKAVTSGISKATGTEAGAIDEIGDVANKADDVADLAENAGKMDDIAEITHETINTEEDVLKNVNYSGEKWYNYYVEKYGKENVQSTFIKEIEYQPSSGIELEPIKGKTTTVLGRYDMDTKAIFEETGNIKSINYDGHEGIPDELSNAKGMQNKIVGEMSVYGKNNIYIERRKDSRVSINKKFITFIGDIL